MLGYIPRGQSTISRPAHSIPKGIKGAIEKIVAGTPVEYDVGLLGDRPFSYVAAFGAFTDVAYLTPQEIQRQWFGRTAYIAEAAKRLFSLTPIEVSFTHEGKRDHGTRSIFRDGRKLQDRRRNPVF